ncbi:MAG: hypothetical protein WD646_12110 [Actinomycetota bacterium]
MRRKGFRIALGAALLVAIALVLLFVVFPSGSSSVDAAMLDRVSERADESSAKVLAQQDWGDGRLVVAGYDRRGERRLAIAFVQDALRGWRVRGYTEELVELHDVVVGSLVIATSEGGSSQPAWSVAVGELEDPRIQRIEVRWASGDTSTASRSGDAYLSAEEGETEATVIRYLAEDGTEIARVPIEAG